MKLLKGVVRCCHNHDIPVLIIAKCFGLVLVARQSDREMFAVLPEQLISQEVEDEGA